jgi:endonuclease YncB( thermonuclease family)
VSDLYTYRVCKVVDVKDGDTFSFSGIDLGFGTHILMQKGTTKPSKRYPEGKVQYYSVRFDGIDTPESKKGWWVKKRGLVGDEAAIQKEIKAGLKAKAFTKEMIEQAREVRIKTLSRGPDNFGRFLAVVWVVTADGDVVNLCEELLKRGLAKVYKK